MKVPFTLGSLPPVLASAATLGVLVGPWFLVAPQHEEKLVFAPRVGSKLAKQFEFELDLRVTSIEMNGSDRGGQPSELIQLLTSVEFIDSYEKVEAGRPVEFVRRFGGIHGTWKDGGESHDIEGFDALTNAAVRFTWKPTKQVYLRSMDSGKVQGLDLDQLVSDMDLCAFLPEGPVAPNAKWTARGRPLIDALFGSTEMGLLVIPADHFENLFTRDVLLRPLREVGEKEFEIACLLSGAEDSPATHTARIDLRWDGKHRVDATDAFDAFLTAQSPKITSVGPAKSLQLEWRFDGRGTQKWNTAEGHFDSLDLEAAIHWDIVCDLEGLIFWEGPVTVHMTIEGVAKWTMRAKREP